MMEWKTTMIRYEYECDIYYLFIYLSIYLFTKGFFFIILSVIIRLLYDFSFLYYFFGNLYNTIIMIIRSGVMH